MDIADKKDEKAGRIFDIQRYSVHDGPGIRTTVFFKGCPLKCLWCGNPESQKNRQQLLYFQSLCLGCHECVEVCPHGANHVLSDGILEFDRSLCQACGKCVEVCPADARQISGSEMTVDEVMEIVDRDALFYANSGGGMTVSGGEPTAQPGFLLNLFKACHRHGHDTALDTCGSVAGKVLEPILEHTDLVLFDIKHMDPEQHRKLTGVDNRLILENAKRIAAAGIPMILRVPLIPGCNDSEHNVRATAQLALDLGGVEINLLTYHRLGLRKYSALGLHYPLEKTEALQHEEVEELAMLARSYGVPVETYFFS